MDSLIQVGEYVLVKSFDELINLGYEDYGDYLVHEDDSDIEENRIVDSACELLGGEHKIRDVIRTKSSGLRINWYQFDNREWLPEDALEPFSQPNITITSDELFALFKVK